MRKPASLQLDTAASGLLAECLSRSGSVRSAPDTFSLDAENRGIQPVISLAIEERLCCNNGVGKFLGGDSTLSRQRRWQLRKESQRKCKICGAKAVSRFFCATHLKQNGNYGRQRQRKRAPQRKHDYHRKRKAGMCVHPSCTKPVKGHVRCKTHEALSAEYGRRYRMRRTS